MKSTIERAIEKQYFDENSELREENKRLRDLLNRLLDSMKPLSDVTAEVVECLDNEDKKPQDEISAGLEYEAIPPG